MQDSFVIGVDFGTDSVRAVLVNASSGEIVGSEKDAFRRWMEGRYCDPANNQFRQHPSDHFESLERAIRKLLSSTKLPKEQIKAISVDTTGSSPIAIDKDGKPLTDREAFKEDPNAMVILWKDHTSIAEANQINELAKSWGGQDYTLYSGGIYSSEWFWSKIFRVVKSDPVLEKEAWTWMEHCDFIAFKLTGSKDPTSFKISRCAAGHKGMWHESWGGYPSKDFLEKLHPSLARIRQSLPHSTFTSDTVAGKLDREWAEKLGLAEDTVVSVGILDAHAGALGSGIKENVLVKVMGTSTCDMLVSRPEQIGNKVVPGISGQVDGSIIPGMIGFEAGQSAFGDVLAWFKNILNYSVKEQTSTDDLLQKLSADAEKLPVNETDVLALDWINGRRTPDANQALKGALTNITIGAEAPHLYRSLVEGICFGARAINDRFKKEGLIIEEIVGVGGVAEKSPYVMQTLADILQQPIKISAAAQSGALGCAMYASVCAGIHSNIEQALEAIGKGFHTVYEPDENLSEVYNKRYRDYLELGAFTETQISRK